MSRRFAICFAMRSSAADITWTPERQAQKGLALCDALEPPDLLITDLILPGATGPVIVERMRQRAPEVKVLLMSGYAEHPLLDAAHAAGEPCLVKPFEIAAFSETVARLLAA